ncbi:MAG: amidase, partial [Rhodospirillaceae bacterium]|nr:amidase [Rhodospirillaceae bacterium]
MDHDLCRLTASEAAQRIAARDIKAEELVRSCLDRIEAREATVGAWEHVDP